MSINFQDDLKKIKNMKAKVGITFRIFVANAQYF